MKGPNKNISLLQSHEYRGWNCLNISKAHSFHQQLAKRIAVHEKFHAHNGKAELKRNQWHLDEDHCEHLWHHRKTHHVQLSCLASDSTLTTSWQWDQNHRSPSSIHNGRDTLACKIAEEVSNLDLQDDGEKQRKTLTKFMKRPASDQNLRPMTMEIHLGSGTNYIYNHLNLPSKIKQVWLKHWMHNEPT